MSLAVQPKCTECTNSGFFPSRTLVPRAVQTQTEQHIFQQVSVRAQHFSQNTSVFFTVQKYSSQFSLLAQHGKLQTYIKTKIIYYSLTSSTLSSISSTCYLYYHFPMQMTLIFGEHIDTHTQVNLLHMHFLKLEIKSGTLPMCCFPLE